MPNSPPSSTSSQFGERSPDVQNRVTRKRNRIPLSCGPCRHRNGPTINIRNANINFILKCNRAQPCDNCARRGDAASCSYAAPARRRTTASQTFGTPDEMQNRIDRLENLVLSLMNNGGSTNSTQANAVINGQSPPETASQDQSQSNEDVQPKDDDSDVEQVGRAIGVMKVQNDRQFFASEAHWWTILSDIAEVKRYFAEHQKQFEDQLQKVMASKQGQSSAGLSLLLGGTIPNLDKSVILSNFPPRNAADKLISRFFQIDNLVSRLVHGPTFRKEYDRHWINKESSLEWLSMCFSMMGMALNSYAHSGDEPPQYSGRSKDLCLEFSTWAAQCLMLADYTQPKDGMLEALSMYIQLEYVRCRDTDTSLWMVMGLTIRLALRMGCHREGQPYASVRAFRAEMRRRVWHYLKMMDVAAAFHTGLPHMIPSIITDTELPSNLYDEDFDADTRQLPASRPATETTSMSFFIAYARLSCILAKIQEHSVALQPHSYEATMKLDGELLEAYHHIPEQLCLGSGVESTLDPANVVAQRFTIDQMFRKSQCLLHRKFLSKATKEPRFWYSRRSCVEACMAMLRNQAELFSDMQKRDGRLRSTTWAVTLHPTTHDFLLSAMIVCLDLYHTAMAEAQNDTNTEMYNWAFQRRDAMFAAIEKAVSIWEALQDVSMEAYKASLILKIMLQKLHNQQMLRQQLANNFSFVSNKNGVAADGRIPQTNIEPEHSAAMTLGMMSTGGLTPDTKMMFDRGYQQPPMRTGFTPQPPAGDGQTSFGNFQNLDFSAQSLDWDGWEQYIESSNLSNPMGSFIGGNSNNLFDGVGDFTLMDGAAGSFPSPIGQQYPSPPQTQTQTQTQSSQSPIGQQQQGQGQQQGQNGRKPPFAVQPPGPFMGLSASNSAIM